MLQNLQYHRKRERNEERPIHGIRTVEPNLRVILPLPLDHTDMGGLEILGAQLDERHIEIVRTARDAAASASLLPSSY